MSMDILNFVTVKACAIRDLIDQANHAMGALICAEDLRFELNDNEQPPKAEETQSMAVLRAVMVEASKENLDEMLALITDMNHMLAELEQATFVAESIDLLNRVRCRIAKVERFIQAVLKAEALNQRLVSEGIAEDLSYDALHTFQAACTAVAATGKGLLTDARTDLFFFCQKLKQGGADL